MSCMSRYMYMYYVEACSTCIIIMLDLECVAWFIPYRHLSQTPLFSDGSWGRLDSSVKASERSAPAIKQV